MQKRNLGLIVFLIITTFFISGCIVKESDKKSATGNNAINNQNQEQNSNPNQNQNQANIQSNETVNPSGSYSVNELFSMNRPMQCTWKESANGDKDVTNLIYLNGRKFYQDVTMGDIGHSFMIYDGEYLYIWNDFNDMASMMKNTQTQTGIEPKNNSAGLDQKKDFICKNWVADNSFFTPPKDKNFKDVTEEMNQAVQEMGNGGLEKSKQQACDLCRNAPSQELRDKCMEDIQCN